VYSKTLITVKSQAKTFDFFQYFSGEGDNSVISGSMFCRVLAHHLFPASSRFIMEQKTWCQSLMG